MFTASNIAIAIGLALLGSFPAYFLNRKRWLPAVSDMLIVAVFLAGVYLIFAGVDHWLRWDEISAGWDFSSEAARDARSKRRGGLVLLLIQFWPYALTALGGFTSYYTALLLGHILTARRTGDRRFLQHLAENAIENMKS